MRDQIRKEPVLADIESLERLLLESLPQGMERAPPPATKHQEIQHQDYQRGESDNAAPHSPAGSSAPPEGGAQQAPRPFDLSSFTSAPYNPAPQEHGVEASLAQQGFNSALMQLSRIVDIPVGHARQSHTHPMQPSAQAPVYSGEYVAQIGGDQHQAPSFAENYPQHGRSSFMKEGNQPQSEFSAYEPSSPLDRAEAQLALEVAKASIQAGGGVIRSRRIFFALAGVALAGIGTIIGMSILAGRGKPGQGVAGEVPVIAAKSTPAKEKPDNPGGIEIPDQNKQVLASRGTAEVKPTQILNTAEQPVDLTQVTRKDPVRMVLPNPMQPAAPEAVNAPQPSTSLSSGLEPKRVSSVRLGAAGEVTAPPAPTSVREETSRALAPASTPLPPSRPVVSSPPGGIAPGTSQAQSPAAKSESRPTTPAPRPAPSTPSVQPTAPAPHANAPMMLTQDAHAASTLRPAIPAPRAVSPSLSAEGGYAIQLASRLTEADARAASAQLRTRYSAQLDGKPVNVVSGEADGRTVYRVRAGGFSQAGANAACAEIKTVGGGCFVTKQ